MKPRKWHGIGWAVKQLRKDRRVCRSGWNGKDMYLFLISGRVLGWDGQSHMFSVAESAERNHYGMVQDAVYMKTAQGTVVPWLCSQSDLLAIDWELGE